MGIPSTRSSSPGLWARTSTPRSRFVFQSHSRDWCAHASTSCRRQHKSRCCSQRPRAVRPSSCSQTWTSPSTYSIARSPRGVIERTDGTIRFTHPLLASVVYHGVSADERRRAHGRLALVVADPLDRARHLALSTESPDSRDRRCSRGCRGLGEHPWGTNRRGRARGARASGSRRRTPTATGIAERSLRRALQRSAGEWTRARSDSRRSPRGETSGFLCAPRRLSCLPSSRANVVPSHCSRKPCARQLRGQRFSRSSTVGSRGRAPSQGSTMHVERSSSPTSSTTTSCEDRPARCKPSSVGSPAKRKHRRICRRGSATSRALSVANCWCGRRLWPS